MTLSPPPEKDNEKRLFLALLLSTLVLLASSPLLNLFAPATPPEEVFLEGEPVKPPSSPRVPEVPPEPPAAVTDAAEGDIVGEERVFEVTNQDMVLRFSTRGAVIESIRLFSYLDVPVSELSWWETIALLWRWSRPQGEPLELVPQLAPGALPRPLAVSTERPDLQALLDQAVYKVEGVRSRAPVEVRFLYQRGSLRVERKVRVPAIGYDLEVSTRVYSAGRRVPAQISLGAGMGPLGAVSETDFASPGIAVGKRDSIERFYESEGIFYKSVWFTDSAQEREVTLPGGDWVALDSQYFTRAILGQPLSSVQMRTHSWQGETAAEAVTLVSVGATGAGEGPLQVYFGPKNLDTLRSVSPDLGDLVDYGVLSFLVKPLVSMLKWIYALVQNYGLAIILLTFLINLALVPIRYKQIVSMKKMTEVQPQLKAIQNRYKDLPRNDPKKQEMNKEVMALYKQHGVNPLGSCLPLLLQMPFLFAFFTMLRTSIELRGESFLWIGDLSKYDLTFVTPVLMGVTMLAQQKMTPATGDPAQRKMMMMMPVVFTYIFLWMSSGLNVYFLFSNIFGMLFQVIVQRVSPELSKKVPKALSTPKRNSKGRKAKSR